MIKRETDYAIRTVLCLARSRADSGILAMSTAELAAQACVPYRFLRKIVLKLASSGILKSRRGRGGGLALACEPRDITLLHLMQVMEPESVILNQCMEPASARCNRQAYCGLHGTLGKIQEGLQAKLAGITLVDMAAEESRAMARL